MFGPSEISSQAGATPYSGLSPDTVLDAVESLGLVCDGRLLALNSYENRVYQVGLETDEPVIVKFYRPGRWSDEAIDEEHAFSQELVGAELPVVAPTAFNGQTLHHFDSFRMAVFQRRGGHAPEMSDEHVLRHLGRLMGRLHAVGASGAFRHRPELDPTRFAREPARWLLENGWIPMELERSFSELTGHLLEAVDACWSRAGELRYIRLHGDCHPGNILWRDEGCHFVDLDDALSGPPIQDLWMFLSGERDEQTVQLNWLLEEYRRFAEFDPRQLHLVEPLRTVRLIYFNAWLARRWDDPAFPGAFPWFRDSRHWESVIIQLQEQLSALQEPPLQLGGVAAP